MKHLKDYINKIIISLSNYLLCKVGAFIQYRSRDLSVGKRSLVINIIARPITFNKGIINLTYIVCSLVILYHLVGRCLKLKTNSCLTKIL